MKRVLHLVRSEPAALPADAVADSDMVVYTRMPPCPPAITWFLWRPDTTPGTAPGTGDPFLQSFAHDQAAITNTSSTGDRVIDSRTLCELVFQADAVVVW